MINIPKYNQKPEQVIACSFIGGVICLVLSRYTHFVTLKIENKTMREWCNNNITLKKKNAVQTKLTEIQNDCLSNL